MTGPSIGYAALQIVPVLKGIDRSINAQLGSVLGPAGRQAGGVLGKGVEGGFRQSLGSLPAIATAAAATVTAAFGAGAVGIASYGLKLAAANETAAVSFNVLLGSAEKAGVFLDELRDFAATTPFEFPELQKSASQLLAAGIAAEDIIPILTNLGNSTAAFNTGADGIRRATVALQQMNAAGKITGQDLLQLREAGVPVYELLAAATGKTKEEVTALANAGKLGAAELRQLQEALVSGVGLEKFAGLMDQQSQTLKGIIANLEDTLGQGLATVFTPLAESAKEFLPSVLPAFETVAKSLSGFLKPLADDAGPIITKFVDNAVTGLTGLLDTITPLLPALLELFDGYYTAAGPILESITGLFTEFSQQIGPELIPLAESLSQVFKENSDSFVELFDALVPLVPVVADLVVALTPIIEIGVRLFAFFANATVTQFASRIEAATPAIEAFAGAVTAVLGPLATLADRLGNPGGSGDFLGNAVTEAQRGTFLFDAARVALEGLHDEASRPPVAGPTLLESVFGDVSMQLGLISTQRTLEESVRSLAETQETAAGRGSEIAALRADAARQQMADAQAVADAEEAGAERIAAAQQRVSEAVDAVNDARVDQVKATAELIQARKDEAAAWIGVAEAIDQARDRLKLVRDEQLPLADADVADAEDALAVARQRLEQQRLEGDDYETPFDDVAALEREVLRREIALAAAQREALAIRDELTAAEGEGVRQTDEVSTALGIYAAAQEATETAEQKRLDSIAAVNLAIDGQELAELGLAKTVEEAQDRIDTAHATMATNAQVASDGIQTAIDEAKEKLPELELAVESAALSFAEDWDKAGAPITAIVTALDKIKDGVPAGSPIYDFLDRLEALGLGASGVQSVPGFGSILGTPTSKSLIGGDYMPKKEASKLVDPMAGFLFGSVANLSGKSSSIPGAGAVFTGPVTINTKGPTTREVLEEIGDYALSRTTF